MPMTIGEFYRGHYEPIRLLGAAPATIADYRSVMSVSALHSSEPIEAFTLAGTAEFFRWLKEVRHASHPTVNKYRRYGLSVLRYANKIKVTSHDWLDDVPRMPEVLDEPEGWLLDEVEALLSASRRMSGLLAETVEARNFWPALLLVLFDTGARITATMSLRSADFDPRRRTLSFRAATQKQRRGQRYRISDQTTASLAAIYCPHRQLLFPWPHDQSLRQWPTLTKHMRRIIDAAGLIQPRKPFHKLRATSGSLVEEHGGSGATHLGHSSPQVFAEHYRDSRIVSAGQVDRLPRPQFDEPSAPACSAWALD